ncbi:MAG: 5'-nucleotidase C-terminal domain-containing protein [Solibacillus sp.]
MKKQRKYQSAALVAAVSAITVGAVGVAASTSFTDVSSSHPYSEAIELLAVEGIISGFGDGTFKPDANVTRGQAAKMLAGTLQLDTTNVINPQFIDIPTTHQYYGAIAALENEGYIAGDEGLYKQAHPITHKQIATILSRIAESSIEETIEALAFASVTYEPAKHVTRGELAAILGTILAFSQLEDGTFDLSLLHVNDTHAHVEMFPQLVAAVNTERAENPDALLLHAGDMFSGTLYFTEFSGQADLPFLNMLDFDAVTLGNHEFDLGSSPEGHQALVDFVKASDHPYVTANVDFSKDSRFNGLFSDLISSDPENGKIYSGIVKEVNGEKIGIFGLTTEETKDIAFVGSVEFENYIDEAKKTVAAFEGMGVNKIIALTHLGFDDAAAVDNDQQLAKFVAGIDIIVGGHTHTKLEEPVIIDKDSESTIIVQANEYGKYLGTLDVTFDEDGIVLSYAGELLDVTKYPADPEALKILAPFKEKIDAFSTNKIGVKLTKALENPRVDAEGNGPSVRSNETVLGNIITDGMLRKAKEFSSTPVIMAVQNGGGIRSEIPAGDVTVGQIITVLPFGNTLALANVTGKELKDTFETSVAKYPQENGGFLHIAGGKLTFDASKPEGSRVVSLQYYDEQTKRYVDLEDTKTYTIATNAFTARGGDGYDVLANVYSEGRVKELGLSDWENLMEQFVSLKTIPTATEGRITNIAK